jgi:K+/H+ antiporter YhaU regulatory subunit KhtT
MNCESKVSVKYTIEGPDQTIIADHETGDDEIYVRKQLGHTDNPIVLTLSAEEAEQLSEALKLLAVKMRHEEAERGQ